MKAFLLSMLGGTLKDWIKSRSKIEETRALAKAESAKFGIPGWTDEFLVVVWSYPAIACFVPALQESAAQGVAAFSAMPDWYQIGFMTISAAVFGIDRVFRFKK